MWSSLRKFDVLLTIIREAPWGSHPVGTACQKTRWISSVKNGPFCALSRVVCGHACGTETGCSHSKSIDVWGASWQCDRVLRCLSGSDDLAGGLAVVYPYRARGLNIVPVILALLLL